MTTNPTLSPEDAEFIAQFLAERNLPNPEAAPVAPAVVPTAAPPVPTLSGDDALRVENEAKLKNLNRLMTDAITAETQLRRTETATPEQRAAAKMAVDKANKDYWDFKNYVERSAPGARESTSAEMQALDPGVRQIITDAPHHMLFLHNDHFPAPQAAARIFDYFSTSGEMYRRGDAVVELVNNRMKVLTPTAFRSRLNKKGRKVFAINVARDGNYYFASKHCGEDAAKVLLSASEVELLPEIKLVAAMPLLVEVAGKLMMTQPGFNFDSGVLVTGKAKVRDVPLQEAVDALKELLCDFQFATPGDKSRGISGLVAPAFRMGNLLWGDALIQTVEADASQTGKGTYLKLTHAIYGEKAYALTKKDGGVGSFDESLGQALMSGAPFVTLDNLREHLNSTYLEHTITPITHDRRVAVRVPHRGEIMVDTGCTTLQTTSNGFSSTKDLANRTLITRLLHQPKGYEYRVFRDGKLLQHVEKNAAYYLSCVHSVVRHWHAAGKPQLPTDHTFKDWVGTLDWIIRNVFKAVPLLEGHDDAATRLGNPGLSWLRQVAIAVLREGKAGQELRAGDLREICERANVMPDGVKATWEDNQAERAIGKALGQCFDNGNSLQLDGIAITRTEREQKDGNYMVKKVKFYTFAKIPNPS